MWCGLPRTVRRQSQSTTDAEYNDLVGLVNKREELLQILQKDMYKVRRGDTDVGLCPRYAVRLVQFIDSYRLMIGSMNSVADDLAQVPTPSVMNCSAIAGYRRRRRAAV